MRNDRCHVLGCNNLADSKCCSCANVFCNDHFDKAHRHSIFPVPLSFYSYTSVYLDFCDECWKEERNKLARWSWMVMIGLLAYLLLVMKVIGL